MKKMIDLIDVFKTKEYQSDVLDDLIEKKIEACCHDSVTCVTNLKGTMVEIDLEGKTFILDRPLELTHINLIRLTNGTLIAGPDFPKDKYLIMINNTHGLEIRHLFLECSKISNGIYLQNFFRVRIEDCYIVHQKEFGIYSSPTIGGNHELEVFKCHISEFLFGDGYPKKKLNYGVIPKYDVDANRQSTGIYLGQADNVVADCNINLCRVGIFSGMRANRIHGNHITGGGSQKLEIYKGIELNNFNKSSAMITNNYIDNCCLWINCDADEKKNLRNYFHVTDNLFYRGYNHPLEGDEEFHHIVINPFEKDSLIANLHICDNNFYNQPENLNGIKPRIITPIHVTQFLKNGDEVGLDPDRLIGVSVKNNYFTNLFPTYVIPLGSEVIKERIATPEQHIYKVSFDKELPLGNIVTAKASIVKYIGEVPPVVTIKNIIDKTVIFHIVCKEKTKIQIEVSSENRYAKRYDYVVK